MSQNRRCSACGTPLRPGWAEGLCERCLLRAALRPRAEEIRAEVLRIGSAAERAAFVEEICGDAPELRDDILAWLKDPQKSFPAQAHSFELGVCAGKIFEKANLSQSTISVHLATLQKAGLVTPQKVGQWIFYSRNEALIAKFLRRINHEL